MKGQYFSFDAVVAAVIMAIAMSSLAAYWLSTQSVVDSRANPLYSDAVRVADSLLSPGVPSGWEGSSIDYAAQIGIAEGFGNVLDRGKLNAFKTASNDLAPGGGYEKAGKIMRATANYFVWIEQTDDASQFYQMGRVMPANATEVVIAYRGVALPDAAGQKHPARMRVFLWR